MAGERSRRWWKVLGVFALLALLGWWFVDRQLEPQRLTATVLTRLGSSLKLDIAFDGTPDYAFKPEPRLRVPNIVVTDPATGIVVLRAKRLEASLPWTTIRGDGGGDIVITRLELDEPVLDVDGLQRWLAARPKAPFKLPTLTKGAAVANGTVVGNGWRLEDVDLDLPHLATGAPVDLDFALRARRDATDVRAKGQAHLDSATASSAYRLATRLELAHEPEPRVVRVRSAGSYRLDDDGVALLANSLDASAASPLPSIAGEAWLDKHAQLALGFRGELAEWEKEWPALPPPVGAAKGPHPVIAVYRGKPDFSDPVRVGVALGPARAQVAVRVREMLAWLDAPAASPLPPLTGTASVPELDFEGAVLKGVRAEMREDAPAEATAPSP